MALGHRGCWTVKSRNGCSLRATARAHTNTKASISAVSDLFMKSVHGQQACLGLLGVLLGGACTGEGFAVPGSEAGLAAQEAWHEEVKQGPELQHVVLDWGARQNEAVLRHQCLASLQWQPLLHLSTAHQNADCAKAQPCE